MSPDLHTVAPVVLMLMLAGCHDADRAAADGRQAANHMAGAADTFADSLDRADNAAAPAGAAARRAEAVADHVAGIVVPTGSALATDRWVGRWIGVEGTTLDIAKDRGKAPGHYRLTMQYTLDDRGVFAGTADGEAIRFTRPDGAHELYAARGDETGLKWLAEKKDCLMVAKGEGYCRD